MRSIYKAIRVANTVRGHSAENYKLNNLTKCLDSTRLDKEEEEENTSHMSLRNEQFPEIKSGSPIAVRVPRVGWRMIPEARESLTPEISGPADALPEDHFDFFIDAAIQQFPIESLEGKTVRVADGQIEVFSVQIPFGRVWVVSK